MEQRRRWAGWMAVSMVAGAAGLLATHARPKAAVRAGQPEARASARFEPATPAGRPLATRDRTFRTGSRTGTRADDPHTVAAYLREAYGEHAERALRSDVVLDRTPPDDVLRFEVDDAQRTLALTLPERAGDAMALELDGGTHVTVRESDLTTGPTRVEDATSFGRRDGRTFWTRTARGVEEWIALEPEGVVRGAPVVTYEVEGATLDAVGGRVYLRDERGAPRLLVEAPEAFDTRGEPVEVRLEVEQDRIALYVDADREAVLVDPAWIPAGSMSVERRDFFEDDGAVTLDDGRVLLVGGRPDTGSFGASRRSAEIFDPVAMAYTSAGLPVYGRQRHTLTKLSNGRVLVAGGQVYTNGVLIDDIPEIYDPASGVFTELQLSRLARSRHGATSLNSGNVLLCGGVDDTFVDRNTCHRFNVSNNTWTTLPSLTTARQNPRLTKLADGRVLMTGGLSTTPLDTYQVFHPVANSWSPEATMPTAAHLHSATLLADGRVLLVGGQNVGGINAVAYLYDPVGDTWSATGQLAGARHGHAASLLPDGRVLVTGGTVLGGAASSATVEIYDPDLGEFVAAPSLGTGRRGHAIARLTDGRVFVAGGTAGASGEIYGPGAANGTACGRDADCVSGVCTDGVCCNVACGGSTTDCQACSVAAGAAADGVCGPATGTVCPVPDECSTAAACSAGACVGTIPSCDAATTCTDTAGPGFTCGPCPAGTASTTGTGTAVCNPCVPGTYAGVGATACAAHRVCTGAEYEVSAGTPTSDRVCAPVTVCASTEFETVAPTATSDRVCAPLTVCTANEYQLTAPTATSDRICSPLSVCTTTQYEVAPPTPLSDRACAPISACAPDEYELAPPTATTDRVCEPVTVCDPDTFETAAPTATSDRVCEPLTVCTATEYETVAPTATSDRACAPLTVCTASEYETVAPTATSDRACTPLTVCTSTQYESTAPTATGDRVCTACTVCPGAILSECTATSDRVCDVVDVGVPDDGGLDAGTTPDADTPDAATPDTGTGSGRDAESGCSCVVAGGRFHDDGGVRFTLLAITGLALRGWRRSARIARSRTRTSG